MRHLVTKQTTIKHLLVLFVLFTNIIKIYQPKKVHSLSVCGLIPLTLNMLSVSQLVHLAILIY